MVFLLERLLVKVKYMKYIMIATKFGDSKNKWLTNELAETLHKEGNSVDVIALSWLQEDQETGLYEQDGIKVYRYKLPKIFYHNSIYVKYIKQIVFPIFAYFKFRKHLANEQYDRLITFSPSHLVDFLVKKVIKENKTKSYLVLWDFFPYYLQNLDRSSNLFKFLLEFENRSYTRFDKIGVMTQVNKQFLLDKYRGIDEGKVEVLPIWADVSSPIFDSSIREKYGFCSEDIIFVYGGAHSTVQELDNLLTLADNMKDRDNVKFLFIGKGPDKQRLVNKASVQKLYNVTFLDFVPRTDYETLLLSCDVGMISLAGDLLVPSFPSKCLDYMKCSLPILASIDRTTDFGVTLEDEVEGGVFAFAGEHEKLCDAANTLVDNTNLRNVMGKNGRIYFEANHSVNSTFKKIDRSL